MGGGPLFWVGAGFSIDRLTNSPPTIGSQVTARFKSSSSSDDRVLHGCLGQDTPPDWGNGSVALNKQNQSAHRRDGHIKQWGRRSGGMDLSKIGRPQEFFIAFDVANYHPTPGQETPYRAGWQRAADQIEAKADRKFGRRRGLRVLGSGILALSLGIGVAYGTGLLTGGRLSLLVVTPIGAGVVGIVTGIVMMITGENDEARPDA
jgi:hypothetical protein